MGLRRLEFVSAGNADYVRSVWALAGQADLKRTLRSGSGSRSARLAGWHHMVEQWILGPRRRLFAHRLARHRSGVDGRRDPGSVSTKPWYSRWMVSRR